MTDEFKKMIQFRMLKEGLSKVLPNTPPISIQAFTNLLLKAYYKNKDSGAEMAVEKVTELLETEFSDLLNNLHAFYGKSNSNEEKIKIYSEFLDMFSSGKIIRFKTEKEFKELFGESWREDAYFPTHMDILLGRVITLQTLKNHLFDPEEKVGVHTVGGFNNESSTGVIKLSTPFVHIGSHMFIVEESKASKLDYFLIEKIEKHKIIHSSF